MLLNIGEQLTALNLLNRWRNVATATPAERAALERETAEFVDLPDLAVDVHVEAAPLRLVR